MSPRRLSEGEGGSAHLNLFLKTNAPLPDADDLPEQDAKGYSDILKKSMMLLQREIVRLEEKSRRRPLKVEEMRILNEIVKTLGSLHKKLEKTPEQKAEDAKRGQLEADLGQMGQDQLLQMLLPYLDDYGIDVDDLKLKVSKKGKPHANSVDNSKIPSEGPERDLLNDSDDEF